MSSISYPIFRSVPPPETTLLLLLHLFYSTRFLIISSRAQSVEFDVPQEDNFLLQNSQRVDCGSIVTKIPNILVNNPNYPEPTYTKSICETVIERFNSSISHLNVKFRQLELYRPTYEGDCLHDRFVIYTDTDVAMTPILCGIHNGETIQVPFAINQTNLILSIVTSDLDHDRFWSIEINQE